MEKIGIVLSGGGFRGVAHAGVIKFLEEKGIEISHVAGASAGAIAGALFAAGHSSGKIAKFFKDLPLYKLSNYAFNKPGLLDSEKYLSVFKEYFQDDNFDALKKKLFITVTNLETAECKIISSGPLVVNLLASSAFPMLFSPILIDGQLYADGRIMNNFPVEPLLHECDKIIGVYVNPLNNKKKSELHSSLAVIERAYQMSSSASSLSKFKYLDKIIYPRALSRFNSFTHSHLDQIFEIGYQAAKDEFEKQSG